MDIYENIIIGNFLYSLGAAMGKRKETDQLPLAVNLLQQTPLDKSVADVLLRGARTMRILEFKRAKNDSDKETAKLLHLSRALSTEANSTLLRISRAIHWFIGSMSDNTGLNIRIVPYLDFQQPAAAKKTLQEFIAAMVNEAAQSGPDNGELYDRYLEVLANCQGSAKGSSGGLVASVDENGNVSYVVVEDLRELGLTLTQLHSLYQQRQQELTLQLTRELNYERGGIKWTRQSRHSAG
ncbi:hypothetical protein [Duganella radicis]|uniref:Uncharacterized protein n=1 Tax=Duganella radicis TaxID=551988 RepID=A0A6L6PJ29_9BURK|nr:hypothetical protein [Duganella radicis]MTV39013.1 hypothetical protein [Duganella radicis]